MGDGEANQRSSPRPHLLAHDHIIDLFRPEEGFSAKDVGLLGGG